MTTNPTTTNPTTTKPRSRRGRLAAAAATAGIAVVTLAGPAAAQETTEPTEDRTARIELACNRIPNLTERTENVLERINGDADTRGSLLWLDTKIAAANERGRDDLATVLENRRAVRESVVPVLEGRLERLDELAIRCADAGFGQ